jgi:hypothetical protein
VYDRRRVNCGKSSESRRWWVLSYDSRSGWRAQPRVNDAAVQAQQRDIPG